MEVTENIVKDDGGVISNYASYDVITHGVAAAHSLKFTNGGLALICKAVYIYT